MPEFPQPRGDLATGQNRLLRLGEALPEAHVNLREAHVQTQATSAEVNTKGVPSPVLQQAAARAKLAAPLTFPTSQTVLRRNHVSHAEEYHAGINI